VESLRPVKLRKNEKKQKIMLNEDPKKEKGSNANKGLGKTQKKEEAKEVKQNRGTKKRKRRNKKTRKDKEYSAK